MGVDYLLSSTCRANKFVLIVWLCKSASFGVAILISGIY